MSYFTRFIKSLASVLDLRYNPVSSASPTREPEAALAHHYLQL